MVSLEAKLPGVPDNLSPIIGVLYMSLGGWETIQGFPKVSSSLLIYFYVQGYIIGWVVHNHQGKDVASDSEAGCLRVTHLPNSCVLFCMDLFQMDKY